MILRLQLVKSRMILISITVTTIFVLLAKIQNHKNPLLTRVEFKCFKLYISMKKTMSVNGSL